MQYFYKVIQGKATLNKGDNYPIKIIGKFKTDQEAELACEKHFEKVCQGLINLGKEIPQKFYI